MTLLVRSCPVPKIDMPGAESSRLRSALSMAAMTVETVPGKLRNFKFLECFSKLVSATHFSRDESIGNFQLADKLKERESTERNVPRAIGCGALVIGDQSLGTLLR